MSSGLVCKKCMDKCTSNYMCYNTYLCLYMVYFASEMISFTFFQEKNKKSEKNKKKGILTSFSLSLKESMNHECIILKDYLQPSKIKHVLLEFSKNRTVRKTNSMCNSTIERKRKSKREKAERKRLKK